MRYIALFVVVLLVLPVAWNSSAAEGAEIRDSRAEPRSNTVAEPIFNRASVLWPRGLTRTRAQRTSSSQRSPVKAFRQVVRLVDDNAGFAYVGTGSHAEPEMEGGPLLPPLEPPPPLDGSSISAESLKRDAVPIDGAAKQAETGSKSNEEKPATQRESFGWIAGTGDQLGMLEWANRDLSVLDYAAAGDDHESLRVDVGHTFLWLTGPDKTDLPPYLFSIFIDVGTGIKVGDDWSFDVVISPSWNTDFANKSYQLFRLPWQAINTFKLEPEWKLVAGVTDLDREDIHLLPVAGLIYKPLDGSQEFDLIFPRPKAAWRLSNSDGGKHWGYIAGELGGNSYSIQRPNAIHDIVTLRDYRLLVGWEQRGDKRHSCRLEFGWIFGRAVEYASGIGNYNPGQTALIRLSYDH